MINVLRKVGAIVTRIKEAQDAQRRAVQQQAAARLREEQDAIRLRAEEARADALRQIQEAELAERFRAEQEAERLRAEEARAAELRQAKGKAPASEAGASRPASEAGSSRPASEAGPSRRVSEAGNGDPLGGGNGDPLDGGNDDLLTFGLGGGWEKDPLVKDPLFKDALRNTLAAQKAEDYLKDPKDAENSVVAVQAAENPVRAPQHILGCDLPQGFVEYFKANSEFQKALAEFVVQRTRANTRGNQNRSVAAGVNLAEQKNRQLKVSKAGPSHANEMQIVAAGPRGPIGAVLPGAIVTVPQGPPIGAGPQLQLVVYDGGNQRQLVVYNGGNGNPNPVMTTGSAPPSSQPLLNPSSAILALLAGVVGLLFQGKKGGPPNPPPNAIDLGGSGQFPPSPSSFPWAVPRENPWAVPVPRETWWTEFLHKMWNSATFVLLVAWIIALAGLGYRLCRWALKTWPEDALENLANTVGTGVEAATQTAQQVGEAVAVAVQTAVRTPWEAFKILLYVGVGSLVSVSLALVVKFMFWLFKAKPEDIYKATRAILKICREAPWIPWVFAPMIVMLFLLTMLFCIWVLTKKEPVKMIE